MHKTAEPGGGHARGGLHERQRDRSLVRSNPSELRLMDLENTLRMTDDLALTRDGINFNTLQGRRWINDEFQTKIEKMEQELRTTDSLARTSLTGGGRVRGNVPEPLPSCLGPFVTKTGAVAPVAPSSEVRERLGIAPPPWETIGEPTRESN